MNTGTVGVGTRLFLTAAPDLEIGARLTSGHWRGQVVNWPVARREADRQFVLEPLGHQALLEVVWEMVRLREFPDRPGRLDSLFLWSNEEQARAWNYHQHILPPPDSSHADRTTTTGIAGLYVVEVVACRRSCLANMGLISYLNDGDTVDSLMKRARRYWQVSTTAAQGEVLLAGSVLVRRNLCSITLRELQAVEDPQTSMATRTAVRWRNEAGVLGHSPKPLPARAALKASCSRSRPCRSLSSVGWRWRSKEQTSQFPLDMARPPRTSGPRSGVQYRLCLTTCPLQYMLSASVTSLICDHAPAHYWPSQRYWEGTWYGEWQSAQLTRVGGST